jgi:hypothetical protein
VAIDCTNATTLPSGGSCTLSIDFSPLLANLTGPSTPLSEFVSLTDNNLNVTSAVQSVSVSGTGTEQAPAITSANNVTFSYSTGGTFTVSATGVPTPSLGAGALPSFASFIDHGDGTGTLQVPPASKGGYFNMTFKASNGVSPNVFQGFRLTVTEAPAITSTNNTTFKAGYGGRFGVIANGYPIVALSETGALPAGVQFVDNTTTPPALSESRLRELVARTRSPSMEATG